MELIGQVIWWVDVVAPAVLALAAVVWLALMVALLAGRLYHDHYQRKFRIVERRIMEGGDVEAILSRIPAAVIAQEASDPETSDGTALILARHFMERTGRRIRALRLLARARHPGLLRCSTVRFIRGAKRS